jgi:hypothetical protein
MDAAMGAESGAGETAAAASGGMFAGGIANGAATADISERRGISGAKTAADAEEPRTTDITTISIASSYDV